jgi:hypothetical protein
LEFATTIRAAQPGLVFAAIAFELTASSNVTLVMLFRFGAGRMLGGKTIAAILCFMIAAVPGRPALRSRSRRQ